MRLSHISITARDVEKLAAFYTCVFGCTLRRPRKVLSGEAVSRGNGLPDCEITSIWLNFPDADAPFLELMQYAGGPDRPSPRVDDPGLGHLAFAVSDVEATLQKVLEEGGRAQGRITDFGTPEQPVLIVYARDPEGNILELEQPPA